MKTIIIFTILLTSIFSSHMYAQYSGPTPVLIGVFKPGMTITKNETYASTSGASAYKFVVSEKSWLMIEVAQEVSAMKLVGTIYKVADSGAVTIVPGGSRSNVYKVFEPGTYIVICSVVGSTNKSLSVKFSFEKPYDVITDFETIPSYVGTAAEYIGVVDASKSINSQKTYSSVPNQTAWQVECTKSFIAEISLTGGSGQYFINGIWKGIYAADAYYKIEEANPKIVKVRLTPGSYTIHVISTELVVQAQLKFTETPTYTEDLAPSIPSIDLKSNLDIASSNNYIRTTVYTQKDKSTYMQNVKYFDGLGRLIQTNDIGITPDKSGDLITLLEYDDFGRNLNNWLPTLVTNNKGAFVATSILKEKSRQYYNDEAFVKSSLELSENRRLLDECGAGNDWKSNNKLIKQQYFINDGPNALHHCLQFTMTTKPSKKGTYPLRSLHITKHTDEDNNETYEFKDKLGQVVLTRQINNGEKYDTYYVYDAIGNLCAVIPPIASDLTDNGNWDDVINKYVYLYKYDSRNRCIAKKLPGCEWTYYVYDKADRLIFTQDGEQRAKQPTPEWTFNKYDAFGRLIISGIYRTASTHEAMLTTYSTMLFTETPGSGNFGYSWTTLASIPVDDVLLINYYDDYEAMLKTNSYYKTNLDYNIESGYGIRHSSAKGLLVGTRVKLMGSDGKSNNTLEGQIATAMYYDTRGRVIQTKSTNHLGGLEKEYIAYNFTGQPTKKMHIHTKDANGGGKQTEVYTYTYDHAGRLLTTTHQLTDGTTVRPQVTLAENTYDELGRLKTNKKGGVANALSTYGYNIRSWTKSITSPLFTQTLYYNDVYGGSKKQYNGNIGAMNWQVNDGGSLLGYTFNYDNLSRLTSAVYLVNGAVSTAHTDYKTSYSYDKHGNMKTLTRGGVITATTNGLIDNLTMTYTGNQLTKVDDAVGTISLAESMDFKNYSNVATEYTYNANGAMTKDFNKGITEIQYNSLNLPKQMDIKSPVAEARNEYTYSAGGQKLKVVQKWNPNYSTTPVIGSAINTTALTQSKTTDYVGNKIYENGTLKRILIDGGYIEGNVYHYYLTDHLGNNRVVVNASGTLVQKNHYYPFGSIFAGTTGPDKQPYKYNGKELDQMHGLNLYDYSARYYESAVGRFTSVDPLAEKYYSISPYAYVANNPIKYVDLKGDSLTLYGQQDHIDQVSTVHNSYLDGYYTFSAVRGSKTSLVATNKDRTTDPTAFAKAKTYFEELNAVVNGTEGTAYVRVVSNSENALVGNFNDAMIDIGDIQQLPLIQGNNIVTQGSTLIHETVEQYQTQVMGQHNYADAHQSATTSESNIIGVVINPNREINNISRSGPATGFMTTQASDGRRQTIMFRYNNNIRLGNVFR